MDSKKFVEIKKPVEEIREVEEVKLETPKVEKVEAAKESSSSQETPNESERIEEGLKGFIGGEIEGGCVLAPSIGVPAAGTSAIGGKTMEGVGKLADDEGTEAAGRVLKESGAKPFEDAGKGFKKVGKGIKEIFE